MKNPVSSRELVKRKSINLTGGWSAPVLNCVIECCVEFESIMYFNFRCRLESRAPTTHSHMCSNKIIDTLIQENRIAITNYLDLFFLFIGLLIIGFFE